MTSWLKTLVHHHETMYLEHAYKPLILLLDVDGVILDMRYQIRELLKEYDRCHQTCFFRNLALADIGNGARALSATLNGFSLPAEQHEAIESWCHENYWTSAALASSHKASVDIFNLIRWFQVQPNTHVGVVSGRFEKMRQDTLSLLNRLGRPYRVCIANDMLYLRPDNGLRSVAEHKVCGIQHFQQRGFLPIAMMDSELQNLQVVAPFAMAQMTDAGPYAKCKLLLLHANTISLSTSAQLTPEALLPPITLVQGNSYALTSFMAKHHLPRDIQVAWDGVNDRADLMSYLIADIEWAALKVTLDPAGGELIVRRDSFQKRPYVPGEKFLPLDQVVSIMHTLDKGVRLDLEVSSDQIDRAILLIEKQVISSTRLWVSACLDILTEERVRHLAHIYPKAIIECPIGFRFKTKKQTAIIKEQLDKVAEWGINRFSISWHYPEFRELFLQVVKWGFETNIHDVDGLEAFLQAILLTPNSVTTDFYLPSGG